LTKLPTTFLLPGSRKVSADRSLCGNSFAFGITLDKRFNTFKTAIGGSMPSATLAPKQEQIRLYMTHTLILP